MPSSTASSLPGPDGAGDAPRPRRSDAKRNVVALLEAAKTVFEKRGVDAPAKEITDAAGVGVGTLYRHFPRRSDLIVAVLQHEIDDCIEAADEFAATLEPRASLLAWIHRFTDFVATKHGLASALHSGDPAYDDLPNLILARLDPVLEMLLARVGQRDETRDDLTAREILIGISLLCRPVPSTGPDFNERAVHVFTEGLLKPKD